MKIRIDNNGVEYAVEIDTSHDVSIIITAIIDGLTAHDIRRCELCGVYHDSQGMHLIETDELDGYVCEHCFLSDGARIQSEWDKACQAEAKAMAQHANWLIHRR